MKIAPKLYCDVHFLEKSSKLNKIIQNNLILAKHGQTRNILKLKKIDQNTFEILSLKEKFLSFSEDVDLAAQKVRISQKVEKLKSKLIL